MYFTVRVMGRKQKSSIRRSWAGLDPSDYGISLESCGFVPETEIYSSDAHNCTLRMALNRDQYHSGAKEVYVGGKYRGRTVDDILMEDAELAPKKCYRKKD